MIMKKIIFSVLFLTCFLTSKSQESVFPLYQDNPIWKVYGTDDYQQSPRKTWLYFYEKDTVICDTLYAIVKLPKNTGSPVRKTFVKVDGERVWYKNANTCNATTRLLYDFSLKVGDTTDFQSNIVGVVSKIDTVVNGSESRKRFELRFFKKNTNELIRVMFWIEKIGSDFHPFYFHTSFIPSEVLPGEFTLQCLEQNGEVIYKSPDFDNCDIINNVSSQSQFVPVIIYPNPVQAEVFIKNVSKNSSYNISDLTGRIIKTGVLSESNIDVSMLNSGTYVLQVIEVKKQMQLFRFVKD
jgi:hypothetical protein